MGCQTSKAFHADQVDDSIHAMLEREKRQAMKKGENPHGYRPRDPHPLLMKRRIIACEEEEDMKTMEASSVSSGWRDEDSATRQWKAECFQSKKQAENLVLSGENLPHVQESSAAAKQSIEQESAQLSC